MEHKFFFNLQQKGGAGKSLLSYMFGLKYEKDDTYFFVDGDSSVKSSLQQLKFLQGKTPARFAILNLLDNNNKIDRQLLFENLMELTFKKFESYIIDFGAPESETFPSLISRDYTIEEFKQIEKELKAKFAFNIIVAGSGAYEACTAYLQKMVQLLSGAFEINIYVNQGTFVNHPHLIEEIKAYASIKKNNINTVKFFGDFDITTDPHKKILQKIEQGKGLESYAYVERIKILKEISKI